MSVNVFRAEMRRCLCLGLLFLGLASLAACVGRNNGLKGGEVEMEEGQEEDLEEQEEDTLVYVLPETPIAEAVDESFIDFIYTFIHRKAFQMERVKFPVDVRNDAGEVVETLKNGRSISANMQLEGYDCFVMLLHEDQDSYEYLSNEVPMASVKEVDLARGVQTSFEFEKLEDIWRFTGIKRGEITAHRAFLRFYNNFANDSLFLRDHLESEIFVSLPSSDDEMQTVDGNIDAGQWEAFAPELLTGSILLLDMGPDADDSHSVKMVKCGVASSMMETLMFKKEENDWKLIRYEE